MSSDQTEHEDHKGGHDHDGQFVRVSVSTTAGFFPAEGFDRVPANQNVEVHLQKAQHKLGIKDTTGWIATVNSASGKRQIDSAKTYRENDLAGDVEIDWGPSEGGGG